MDTRILPLPVFTAFLGSFVLALFLPVVSSAAKEAASNPEPNLDQQKDSTLDRPFVADPEDQPSAWRDSWVPVRFMPEDFRIAAAHELETIQETLPLGRNVSLMKWEGRNHSQDVYVEREAFVDGRHVRKTRQTRDPAGNSVLELKLSDKGAELFSQATREMIGRRVAVIIEYELHSVPLVRHEVTGGTVMVVGLRSP